MHTRGERGQEPDSCTRKETRLESQFVALACLLRRGGSRSLIKRQNSGFGKFEVTVAYIANRCRGRCPFRTLCRVHDRLTIVRLVGATAFVQSNSRLADSPGNYAKYTGHVSNVNSHFIAGQMEISVARPVETRHDSSRDVPGDVCTRCYRFPRQRCFRSKTVSLNSRHGGSIFSQFPEYARNFNRND